jgi:hypothetical protein
MTSNPHRWRILAVVATAFLMTILDVSIVNVASQQDVLRDPTKRAPQSAARGKQ